jgi:hypothetical protein
MGMWSGCYKNCAKALESKMWEYKFMVLLYIANSNICSSIIQRELTVAFPWQQWLCQHTTALSHMYVTYLVNIHTADHTNQTHNCFAEAEYMI